MQTEATNMIEQLAYMLSDLTAAQQERAAMYLSAYIAGMRDATNGKEG